MPNLSQSSEEGPSEKAFGVPSKPPVAPYLPATLSFVTALLSFCGFQVYAVLASGWRWSVVGVIALVAFACIGGTLQSYANRRAA